MKKNFKKYYSFLKNNCKKNIGNCYGVGWYVVFNGRFLQYCTTEEEANEELYKFNKEINKVYPKKHCWIIHIDEWQFRSQEN